MSSSSPTNSYHLRPVLSDKRPSTSASDSPTASSSSLSPTEKHSMRPMREGENAITLRDVELDTSLRGKFPNLPAPPTGHDLMAMFPPPAPSASPARRPEPTSGYFHLQERAYFAQAGKEIIRVRVDLDVRDVSMNVDERSYELEKRRSRGAEMDLGGRKRDEEALAHGSSMVNTPGGSRPQLSPQLSTGRVTREHHDDVQHVSPRELHSQRSIPTLHRVSGEGQRPLSPPKSRYPYSPDTEHDPRDIRLSAPEYAGSNTAYSQPDESDESWRRPMPYAERRRAGKHTRRVIVKN